MIEEITDANGKGKIRYFPVEFDGWGQKYKILKSVTKMGTVIYYNQRTANWVRLTFENEKSDILLWASEYDSDLYKGLLHDHDSLKLIPLISKWARKFRVNLMYDDILENNPKLIELEKILGFNFNDKKLLQTALIHKTYVLENEIYIKQLNLKDMHNQRLENIGDAVLDLIVLEYGYSNYPFNEGGLTKFKAFLVNNKKASEIADMFGLDDYLIKGRGENKNIEGKEKRLADTLEAIIGATYIDQGYENAKKFVLEYCIKSILEYFSCDPDTVLEIIEENDPISKFNNEYQNIFRESPNFIKEDSNINNSQYLVKCHIENELYVKGKGKNKNEAKKDASIKGLKYLREIGYIK